jgi:hypothetical protein
MTVSFTSARSVLNVRRAALSLSVVFAAAAGGCANDGGMGNLFSTGALGDAKPAVMEAKASADPVCVSMASQIDGLRKEGSVERLEKASDGKSAAVNVQRSALAKQAQLNKANADFIAKCGPNLPKTAMLAAPVAPVAAATPVKPVAAVKTAAVAKSVAAANASGVTVVPPTATAAAPAVPQ